MENSYHSGNHCKYLIQYHIIWCPKFRYCVLDDVEGTLKQILHRICQKYGYQVKALEVMPDHIHIFIDCPQTVAPCDVVRTLKSRTAVELFQRVFYIISRDNQRCNCTEIHRRTKIKDLGVLYGKGKKEACGIN